MAFGESLLVEGVVVGGVVLPAAVEDAEPFEGEGADGDVAGFAAGALAVIEVVGPLAAGDGVGGPFVHGLADELGTERGGEWVQHWRPLRSTTGEMPV